MSKKAVVGILVVVAVIIVALLVGKGTTEAPGINGEDTTSDSAYVPQSVDAYHVFEDGNHVVAGSVDLPTPCHTLTTDVAVMESFPEQVRIEFETDVDDDLVCTQVITPSDFSVEFEASEEAKIEATFNQKPVELELVEADELPEQATDESLGDIVE